MCGGLGHRVVLAGLCRAASGAGVWQQPAATPRAHELHAGLEQLCTKLLVVGLGAGCLVIRWWQYGVETSRCALAF